LKEKYEKGNDKKSRNVKERKKRSIKELFKLKRANICSKGLYQEQILA
jgi:hypothetical protein